MGPLPGTKWDPSLGQTGLSLFNSTVKSLFCPVCPWDGWGFVPGTIVPQGPSEKCLCVFCSLFFFAPKRMLGQMKSFMWVPTNSGNHSGSCSENCGFRIAQVEGCHSENGISYSENGISNSESCSENTPELSESSENGLCTRRAFTPKLGWSPDF